MPDRDHTFSSDSTPITRLRIVPSQGRSWHSRNPQTARTEAEAYAAEYQTSVAVVEAPDGGLVRQLFVVPRPKAAKA